MDYCSLRSEIVASHNINAGACAPAGEVDRISKRLSLPREPGVPTSVEERVVRDGAKLVRAARLVENAWTHFGPQDSGLITLVIRAYLPINLEVTKREDFSAPPKLSVRDSRFPGVDVIARVFDETQWPEYGEISVVMDHGIPTGIQRTDSIRVL